MAGASAERQESGVVKSIKNAFKKKSKKSNNFSCW